MQPFGAVDHYCSTWVGSDSTVLSDVDVAVVVDTSFVQLGHILDVELEVLVHIHTLEARNLDVGDGRHTDDLARAVRKLSGVSNKPNPQDGKTENKATYEYLQYNHPVHSHAYDPWSASLLRLRPGARTQHDLVPFCIFHFPHGTFGLAAP